MFRLSRLWPVAEVRRLRRENEYTSTALRNTTERVIELQARIDELRNQKCETCETLKQTVNFHVFAAGSRVPMFDGIGPALPVREASPVETPQMQGPRRASRVARNQRTDYLKEFLEAEARSPDEDAIPPS